MKKRMTAVILFCAILIGSLGGCGMREDPQIAVCSGIISAVDQATSVEASVGIDIQARVSSSGSSSGHNTSLGADITVLSTKDPFSYHGEYYANILVDGVSTREDKEYYVVRDENDFIHYEYTDETEQWSKTVLTREETMALPLKTCLIQNWEPFLNSMLCDRNTVSINDREAYLFTGDVPAIFIQELIGDKVFGSFLYSVEHLLDDRIPCTAYFDAETYLPIQIELDFTDAFIVNDMIIENAVITACYSKWSETSEIELPKKIGIVASDKTAEFYATYYAWNLFLPYVGAETQRDPHAGNAGLSFTSSWETYQLRIDQGMTALPLTFESLHNLGYSISPFYSSNILEPNSILRNVPVQKGRDEILCTFFNPDVSPRPIIDCSIGSIDIRASGVPYNGISIFLPGEITLGVSRAALESAYGKPDQKTQGFSSDTYIWFGAGEGQSFTAEISPMTDEVIRICLENVPIMVPETTVPVEETEPADVLDDELPEETAEAAE